ncbi:hypothetical protein [Hydrogenophaga aquatica]|jgi:hypothetical protein
MSTQLLILSLPHDGQAVLSLSSAPTLAQLPELERALAQGLEQLRQELCESTPAAGELEYASWTPLLRH